VVTGAAVVVTARGGVVARTALWVFFSSVFFDSLCLLAFDAGLAEA